MKFIEKIKQRFEHVLTAMGRYPLAFVFIMSLTVVNMVMIYTESDDLYRFSYTFAIGFLFSLVAEHIYERFFIQMRIRFILMGSALVLTFLYLFLQNWTDFVSLQIGIRTGVLALISILLFIWLPSIQSKLRFSQSFFVVFKVFFTSVLFSIVLGIGIGLIIGIINLLLFSTDYTLMLHVTNVIACLFAPVFLLSMMPYYFGEKDEDLPRSQWLKRDEKLTNLTETTPIFDNLLNYVIVPITFIYSVILLLYIAINMTGELWTEALLEPLLVSFTVVVLFVYILALEVDKKLAELFTKVYPKVLLVIVLFQTIASIVKLADTGVTYGRYYAIIFGVFATIMALIYGFLNKTKTGWIAPVFLVFGLISITPPIDAFSVSRYSQTQALEQVLVEEEMLADNEVIPSESVSEDAQIEITHLVYYLDEIQALDEVTYLPEGIMNQQQFERTFGFSPTYDNQQPDPRFQRSIYVNHEEAEPIQTAEGSWLLVERISNEQGSADKQVTLEANGATYQLDRTVATDRFSYQLSDESDQILMTLTSDELFDTWGMEDSTNQELSQEEATFVKENDDVMLTVVLQNLSLYDDSLYVSSYLFITIK